MDVEVQDRPRIEVPFLSDGPPREPGVSSAERLPGDVADRHEARLSSATSLIDLATDYVFFTHGLLFTHAAWVRDPVVDHIAATKGECDPIHVQLPRPVFKFFDAKDPNGILLDDQWNRQVCMVERAKWGRLLNHLAGLAGVNHDTKFLHRVVVHCLPIVDVLALDRTAVLPDPVPVVPCYALEVTGNRRRVYFAPEHRGRPWEPVPVMIGPPDPEVKKFARAFFAGRSQPYADADAAKEAALIAGKRRDEASVQRAIRPANRLGITDAELLATWRSMRPRGGGDAQQA